MPPKVRQV